MRNLANTMYIHTSASLNPASRDHCYSHTRILAHSWPISSLGTCVYPGATACYIQCCSC